MEHNHLKVWELQLENLFKQQTEKEVELIYKIIPLILYQQYNNTDYLELYRLLGRKKFIEFNKSFDGKTIKTLRESDIKDVINFAICFYYKKIEGLNWDEIKKIVPFKPNTISYGLRSKSLNDNIQKELMKELKKYKD